MTEGLAIDKAEDAIGGEGRERHSLTRELQVAYNSRLKRQGLPFRWKERKQKTEATS